MLDAADIIRRSNDKIRFVIAQSSNIDVSLYQEFLSAHKDLQRKLAALENKYDNQLKVVFDTIRAMMASPEKPRKRIGFEVKEGRAKYGKRVKSKKIKPWIRQDVHDRQDKKKKKSS